MVYFIIVIYMKKMKYILKRLKNLEWRQFIDVVKKIAKKTNRSKIVIFFDCIWCGFRYGAGYMDYFEFEFYLLKGKERKTYLTSTINNKIIAKYNDKQYTKVFKDKILFNQTFKEYIHRDFIDLQKSSFEEFQTFLKGKEKIIGKVIDECGGKGIKIYEQKDYKAEELYQELRKNKQYLVEECITQHEKMNSLYAKSVNSLRMISFIRDDGEVEILNIVLRIGNGGEVDNFSSGGMYTFVGLDGKVLIPAIDEKGHIYEYHPISNTKISGFQIPDFETVIKYVKVLAKVEPHVRYVGWDIAVTKDGVDVIEGNEYSGVFQMKPSISHKKEGLLPLYKKYMDI